MSAKVIQIRDYHLRKLEREAAELLGQLVRLDGPGGVDDLVIDTSPSEMNPYQAPEADPA